MEMCGFIIADTEEERSMYKSFMIGNGIEIFDFYRIPKDDDERATIIQKIMDYSSENIIIVNSIMPLANNVEEFISLFTELSLNKVQLRSLTENIDTMSRYSKQLNKILSGANLIHENKKKKGASSQIAFNVGVQMIIQGIGGLDKMFRNNKAGE